MMIKNYVRQSQIKVARLLKARFTFLNLHQRGESWRLFSDVDKNIHFHKRNKEIWPHQKWIQILRISFITKTRGGWIFKFFFCFNEGVTYFDEPRFNRDTRAILSLFSIIVDGGWWIHICCTTKDTTEKLEWLYLYYPVTFIPLISRCHWL